jgi:hypothetical protein
MLVMEKIVHTNGGCLRAVFFVVLAVVVVFGSPLSSLAAKNIVLTWNPSAQTNIVGYSVYYGMASHHYTEKISLASSKAVISDLVENKTYYFAVTASNDLGLESNPSDEVIYTVPPVPVGRYGGLFYERDAVRDNRAGSFVVSVTGQLAYTGSIRVGSGRYAFSGKMSPQYAGTNTIVLSDGTTLTLEFDLGAGSHAGTITGEVSDGVWTADLSGARSRFDPRRNPTPNRGYYTIVFAGRGAEGHGFGTAKVSADGTVRFAGSLADGTKVTQSAMLSSNGVWPLYVPLYSGRGLMMSRIEFVDRTRSDLDGTLSWIKETNAAARFYPDGFVTQREVLGAAYRKAPGFNFRHGTATFNGGNLGNGFTDDILVGSKGNRNEIRGDGLTMKVSASKGTFAGKATDPATLATWPFKGVILQKANIGCGYLAGTNETSQALITKRPPPPSAD